MICDASTMADNTVNLADSNHVTSRTYHQLPQQPTAIGKTGEQYAQIEELVQNFSLVWADKHLDEINEDFRNSITKLQRTIDLTEKFHDVNECLQYISSSENRRIFLVVSGKLASHVVPLTHDKSQVYAMYIFCFNKLKYEHWATGEWPKVRGVFTDIKLICTELRKVARECDDEDVKITGQLEPSFMYSMLFKQIVLEIDFDLRKDIRALAEHARKLYKDKPEQRQIIDQFVKEYNGNVDNNPVRWYSGECFTYKMLNKALGRLDVSTLLETGFFMRDLHQNVEELYDKQMEDNDAQFSKTVFRGEAMRPKDFHIKVQEDKFLSYNNFLSTSEERHVATDFIKRKLKSDPTKIGVLFIIAIDPSVKSVPYARIAEFSEYPDEKEILFSTHTVFRVRQIRDIQEGDLSIRQVNLTLTSEQNDEELTRLAQHIRRELTGTGWQKMGVLLWKINENKKAEEIYKLLLEQAASDFDQAYCYNQLGIIHDSQGDYKQALDFFEESIKVYRKIRSHDHPELATSYGNIALVYNNMGDYKKALEYNEKALAIRKITLPENHPHLATSYSHIGQVYRSMDNYEKALEYYEKDLEITKKVLPENHPHLANSYSQIGHIYNHMGDYKKTLEYYEKSHEIFKIALPENHPGLANSYLSFAACYEKLGDYPAALNALENTLQIQKKTFEEKNEAFACTYIWFGRVYRNMKEYSEALDYFQKCLAILQITSPVRHPNLGITYSDIGDVHRLMGNYAEAFAFYQKALDIQENIQCSPLGCATTYTNLGETYREMKAYATALTYYQKALEIHKNKITKKHPHIATLYHNMAKLYLSTQEYNMAMKNIQQALSIAQEKLPHTDPHLADYRETFVNIQKHL
ncbi:unnamed protein product [Rotaria sp. Silwood2]|nr:unnamed protein product [Rotaria sp. Silwood2]